jgi:hypothetical protein
MKKMLNEWKEFLNEQEEEVAVSSFDKRKQQIVRIHDGFVESLEVEGKFPIGEIPKSVMDALMNAAIVTADAMGGDLNEGEDNRVRKMTPAGDLEYFEMIMESGDSYIVEYDPSSEEVMVYAIQDAGEELAARALRYIHQDLPYDQERFPEDEE